MHSEIQFDKETHTYTLDGLKIPSVTQIISSVGMANYSAIPNSVLENAAKRGSGVHRALELLAISPWYVPPDWVAGYVSAWNNFKMVFNVRVLETERLVFHKNYMYCGRPDRICTVAGEKYIVDIKTTAKPMPSHDIQTAAYALAHKAETRQKLKRASVYLHDNGKFEFKEYKEEGQESVFLAALQIYNWKVRNGIEE